MYAARVWNSMPKPLFRRLDRCTCGVNMVIEGEALLGAQAALGLSARSFRGVFSPSKWAKWANPSHLVKGIVIYPLIVIFIYPSKTH